MSPHNRLAARWRSEGVVRTREASLEQLNVLEARYGVQLPGDFRDYLLNTCPASDDEVDRHFITWWDFDRLRMIAEAYEHPITNPVVCGLVGKSLFFADFAIWSAAWAIVCVEGEHFGRIIVVSGSDHFVADSFGEFIDQYLVDPHRLL